MLGDLRKIPEIRLAKRPDHRASPAFVRPGWLGDRRGTGICRPTLQN